MRSYLSIAVLAVFALSLAGNPAFAAPPSDSATCRISCTVTNIAEWADDSFPAINLAELTTENSYVSGSASLVLYTNGDVKISADNSDAAQLSKDTLHKLVTEYKLQYDAFGANQTGQSTTAWTDYDRFVSKGSTVTHVSGDRAVEVTLSVRVSNDSRAGAEPGHYSATQTLTLCWKS